MHILATFATLCCQTRWPRNHSCTTQEHVSFFRTFSGHFRKFRLFDTFCKKTLKFANSVQNAKKHISQMRTLLQNVFTNAHKCKNISRHARKLLHMHKTQTRKSANVRKTVVHKMRKSAAQIIFEMQLLHFAQKHKCRFHHFRFSALCTIFLLHKFSNAQNYFLRTIIFLV